VSHPYESTRSPSDRLTFFPEFYEQFKLMLLYEIFQEDTIIMSYFFMDILLILIKLPKRIILWY
jgi:hypothetical protein